MIKASSKGYSQIDIATQLQADEPTISRDMAYLRKEAKETLERNLNEIGPGGIPEMHDRNEAQSLTNFGDR